MGEVGREARAWSSADGMATAAVTKTARLALGFSCRSEAEAEKRGGSRATFRDSADAAVVYLRLGPNVSQTGAALAMRRGSDSSRDKGAGRARGIADGTGGEENGLRHGARLPAAARRVTLVMIRREGGMVGSRGEWPPLPSEQRAPPRSRGLDGRLGGDPCGVTWCVWGGALEVRLGAKWALPSLQGPEGR